MQQLIEWFRRLFGIDSRSSTGQQDLNSTLSELSAQVDSYFRELRKKDFELEEARAQQRPDHEIRRLAMEAERLKGKFDKSAVSFSNVMHRINKIEMEQHLGELMENLGIKLDPGKVPDARELYIAMEEKRQEQEQLDLQAQDVAGYLDNDNERYGVSRNGRAMDAEKPESVNRNRATESE